MDSMSLEEARVVWLTMIGSGWVNEDVLMDEPFGSVLDAAGTILDYEAMLEYNHHQYKIKLRCES